MRTIEITESQAELVHLEHAQALALTKAGQALRGRQTWWGLQDRETDSRSVIECTPHDQLNYRLLISNLVGTVVLAELQIIVKPKIPLHHFMHLLATAEYLPRTTPSSIASLDESHSSLWEVVAAWLVSSAEHLLREGLLRGYASKVDDSAAATGKIDMLRTASNFYRGHLALRTEWEEYSFDNPLNRIVRAAVRKVQASPVLARSLRFRARSVNEAMVDVGAITESDLAEVALDRRSAYYKPAVQLSRLVLVGAGLTFATGHSPTWTFLLRTPEPMEIALRRMVQLATPELRVEKRGRGASNGRASFTPDFVVNEGFVVGDVKYKHLVNQWNRADLYQLLAFARVFESRRCLLIGFAEWAGVAPPSIEIADTVVTAIAWRTGTSRPSDAELDFLARTRQWLLERAPFRPDQE